MLFALCFLLTAEGFGGTYIQTKHGTSANRSVVTPGYTYTTLGHCGHCHEQHASIDGAEPTLPASEGASSYALFRSNYGASRNELCFACHETFTLSGMTLGYGSYGIYQGKTKYNASIHYSSASMKWTPDASPPGPAYPSGDAGNCHNCHNPHGYNATAGGAPYASMLFALDSATGDSPAYEMGCEACHNGTQGGAAKDVKAQLNKTYAHPTHTYNNRHTLPETGQPGGTSFGPAAANRHAECVDCHNPHTVVSGTIHTAATSGNAVSDVLKYVWGVEPAWTAIWTQPTSFTVRKPPAYNDGSQYEYQICFKCHSYYGLGTLTNGVSSITGPSGTAITDQAWEFNPNNKSAHPVAVTLNNQTGSGTPKALTAGQMSSPWTSVGTQTMYCSDCHGADNESSAAKGPHGSTRKFMLNRTRQYWPASAAGALFSLKDINDNTNNWSTELFCVNCHPMITGTTWKNDVHKDHDNRTLGPDNEMSCVYCHVAVPHGSKRSRLIGYVSDVSPYDYSDNRLLLSGFKKASSPTTYAESNCYSTNSACSSKHNSSNCGSSCDP
ncbi:MAG: hypothetical protein HY808_14380 [Nitrospirae bacterium]|nr:hypothetical protein [Nitrospirota bacterium]